MRGPVAIARERGYTFASMETARIPSDAECAGEGLLVLEGGFLVERGREAGLRFEALYCVPEAGIAGLAGYPFHRGAVALARRPEPRRSGELAATLSGATAPSTLLALPEAVDPANLGSAFRSAAAFGCAALLVGPGGPDPLCRRALRASMGASLRLPWARLSGPAALGAFAEAGYEAAACVLEPGAVDLRSFVRPPRLALLLGNEAFGLSGPWREACPRALTIPMLCETDSLNLAAAAAVFLYALCSG
jgi:tRNA G18 (ribose-2'-O)-methylase SpoU